ncbi:hypothetical protein PFISCL1PPCAC_542, partial [Pristionchus fissidentatus]
VNDASKPTAFALKLSCKYFLIFLLPMMNHFSSRKVTFVEKHCAELEKPEMISLLDSLREPFNGCKLYLDSTLVERAGECLEMVEACYKMFPIDTLTIAFWRTLPEMDLLANKIALDIKPRRIDLKMEITTPSLNIFGKHCCYLTINETFEAGEIEML